MIINILTRFKLFPLHVIQSKNLKLKSNMNYIAMC